METGQERRTGRRQCDSSGSEVMRQASEDIRVERTAPAPPRGACGKVTHPSKRDAEAERDRQVLQDKRAGVRFKVSVFYCGVCSQPGKPAWYVGRRSALGLSKSGRRL